MCRLDRMKARGRKLKRKRGPRMTFGELVRKVWQREPEGVAPKVVAEKEREAPHRKPTP